jgi:alkanesulfonate monooxygenase SsuD/methylene tetrahydromethanopterin reductase-like flavin-dependent oxidoreductase (luciferase family)
MIGRIELAYPLRFSSGTLQRLPWPELVERWRYLDGLGFDTLWLTDHFANPYGLHDPWFEGWTTLAGLVTHTRRARLGVLVTNITYRNPAITAREALTLDHITGGRLELALGPGGQDSDHAMTGVPAWPPAERVARFGEFAAIVDALLRNEETTFAGRYYRVDGAIVNPRPLQQPRPPLTIAAHGPAMLKLAARYADVWNSLGGRREGTPADALEDTRRRIALLDAACMDIGRDPASLRRSFLAGFTPDRPFASVDAFEDFVGRYRALGIDEFTFFYRPRHATPEMFERVATEVMPKLRADVGRHQDAR